MPVVRLVHTWNILGTSTLQLQHSGIPGVARGQVHLLFHAVNSSVLHACEGKSPKLVSRLEFCILHAAAERLVRTEVGTQSRLPLTMKAPSSAASPRSSCVSLMMVLQLLHSKTAGGLESVVVDIPCL